MRGDFISIRAWLVFLGTEAILAGVLWMIGLLSPMLLIIFGAAILFALWTWDNKPEWIRPRIRRRLSWLDKLLGTAHAAGAGAPAGTRSSDDGQRRELVASWYKMIDDIDEATSSERGFDRLTKIRNELKRRSHYHRLARYLPEDVQEDVNAPSGIRVVAALTVEGEESPDQALLKRLRSCIAGIEAEWGLLGPAQLTSSRNSRAPRA